MDLTLGMGGFGSRSRTQELPPSRVSLGMTWFELLHPTVTSSCPELAGPQDPLPAAGSLYAAPAPRTTAGDQRGAPAPARTSAADQRTSTSATNREILKMLAHNMKDSTGSTMSQALKEDIIVPKSLQQCATSLKPLQYGATSIKTP